MNTITPIAPIDSVPEPSVMTLLACAAVLFLLARWSRNSRATVYWTGGSMDVPVQRKVPVAVLIGFSALIIVAISAALTLWINKI